MIRVEVNVQTGERTEIEMTPEEIAAQAPTAKQLAIIAQQAQDAADTDEVKSIPFVNFLVTHRPAQIAKRISNDIATDGMEAVVIKLATVLTILAKAKFR